MADTTPFVCVSGIRKAFEGTPVLHGVGFEVPLGHTVSLLGPSGCGKTTMLRSIGGLETPDDGRITIGGAVVFDRQRGIDVPTERRQIGMVFQSYAVWPHMTVGENVGFPLKIKRVPAGEIARRVDDVLALVGLAGFAGRRSTSLSGGQQQRVALARAIVHEPRLVLFDEPLSNLDAALRIQMRTELKLLQNRLGFTAIYVTHDQEEALALSDTIVVMNHGRVEAVAPPRELFSRPTTRLVASFLGFDNMYEGVVEWVGEAAGSAGTAAPRAIGIRVADVTLRSLWQPGPPPAPGTPVTLAFRSERVGIRAAGDGSQAAGANEYTGTVETRVYLGSHWDYVITHGGWRVRASASSDATIEAGDAVTVSIKPDDCLVFGRD